MTTASMLDAPMEDFSVYLPSIRQRLRDERAEWTERRQRALAEAKRMADFLRQEYGVSQVYVFGSLVEDGPFDHLSDIDLAVVGIRPEAFYQAYGEVLGLRHEFEV